MYAGDRPASAREGSADSGVSSPSSAVAAAAAVGSMLGMYANPWAPHNYSAFLPYSGNTDLALLSQMGSQYDLKDSQGAHPASLPVHAAQGFYPYGQYPYADPNRAKTATRETTSTLKKIMLAIITRMTLTQVSTWFANARRRLKKENKVTWGRSAEDRDGRIFSSDNEDEPGKAGSDEDEEIDLETVDLERPEEQPQRGAEEAQTGGLSREASETRTQSGEGLREESEAAIPHNKAVLERSPRSNECHRAPQSKPKIWSLAETATTPDSTPKVPAHAAIGSAGHPALLPGHGIYTCQIGKLHNWASSAFLNANSLLNMRSLLATPSTAHAHLPLHSAVTAARQDTRVIARGPGTSGTEDDSDVESSGSFSPKRDESDHRPDSLKSTCRFLLWPLFQLTAPT
uniref:Iroquois homeobox 1b n=1 Tax=Neogobius melanostomus TaxID=47308 RepID=A0A8C6WE22_9GOBI